MKRVCLNLVKHDAKPAKIERHENGAIESADHLTLFDACVAEVGQHECQYKHASKVSIEEGGLDLTCCK